MPLTQHGLPFQGLSPIARQNSYLAAESIAAARGVKTRWYVAYLEQVKQATDHQAARRLKVPRSSICSIRNTLCNAGLVEPVGSTIGKYGKRCTLWALRRPAWNREPDGLGRESKPAREAERAGTAAAEAEEHAASAIGLGGDIRLGDEHGVGPVACLDAAEAPAFVGVTHEP